MLKKRKFTVQIYACDDLAEEYIKNYLKANPHFVPVDPPTPADITLIQADLLTPTEKKIIQSLAEHGTISKVAANLNYSPSTVKVYLSRIYSKFKVDNAIKAIIFAVKYGFVRLEDIE